MTASHAMSAYRYEFELLLRFNLFNYYKFVTKYNVDKRNLSIGSFDSPAMIKQKLSSFVKFLTPKLVPVHEMQINLHVNSQVLDTLSDLDDFIVELNKKRSSYEMRRIMTEADHTNSRRAIELYIWDELNEYQGYTDTVVLVLDDICGMAGLEGKEKNGFFLDLKNNMPARNGFLAIVRQTLEEFFAQALSIDDINKAIVDSGCSCVSGDGIGKKGYSRFSFALVVVQNNMDEEDNDAPVLGIYKCPQAGSELWHLTKSSDR